MAVIDEKFKKFYMGMYRAVADIEMFKAFRFALCSGLLIKADIDKPEGVYRECFSIAYLSMNYKELTGSDVLVRYINDLETYYGLPNGPVSEYYEDLLKDLRMDNVQNVFRVFSDIDLQRDELPVFFDKLLNFTTANFGKEYGVGSTNPMLARLMGKLLEAKPGMTLYDGFCGTGRTILKADNECRLYLQDSDRTVLAVACVNMVVHGKEPKVVTSRDTFFNPIEEEGFDRIVTELPTTTKFLVDDARWLSDAYHVPEELVSGDTAGIMVVLEKLKEDGIAVVLVPVSLLFKSGRTEDFRRYLVQSGHLDCVISLPSGIIPHTGIASALLVMNKSKAEGDGIFFIDSGKLWIRSAAVDVAYLTEETLAELMDLYTARKETNESTYIPKDVILQGEVKLTPGTYLVKESEIKVADIKALRERSDKLYDRFVEVNKRLDWLREQEKHRLVEMNKNALDRTNKP